MAKKTKKDNIDIEETIEDIDVLPFDGIGSGYIQRIPIDNPTEFPSEKQLVNISVIPVDNACAFPFIPLSLPTNNLIDKSVISHAVSSGEPVVFIYCDSEKVESGDLNGFSKVGVIGRIVKHLGAPKENMRGQILSICGPRVKVTGLDSQNGKFFSSLKYYDLKPLKDNKETDIYLSLIQDLRAQILRMGNDYLPQDETEKIEDPAIFLSTLAYQLPIHPEVKNELLSQPTFKKFCLKLIETLDNLLQITTLRRKIEEKTHRELETEQKEMYLRKQMSLIQDELGEEGSDKNQFLSRAENKKWNAETAEHFNKELQKLSRFNSASPDYGIQYTYLDTFLNLPWNEYSENTNNFDTIEEILNRDHFGLERIKERILEQMAVATLRNDNKAPILCFVGPPGVGKTSLGKSIAEAMGREYARVSFGGLHDEAEIRGHRRTYIGAMPGRIMTALAKKKTANPVIVLDEIDKIGNDFKGDPSTALLEVLDPEQNYKFHDNYIDADFDLSKVLFIATANSLETLSAPLRDRMEIISIPGYITAEKVEIAKRHLIPKTLKENGFEEEEILFEDESLIYIIDYFTRESGVRKLEKTISKVLRKLAVKKVKKEEFPHKITSKIVSQLLGKEEFNPDMYETNDYLGVVTGLAWTSVGGEILFIETSLTPGDGKLTLTGNLGDVMKESASIALQYLKAHAEDFNLSVDDFNKTNVHIHVPEGAIPKDGPSAGITMLTSLASSFTKRKVKPKLAMTGEMTLRGKVLPVGGIKEKIIAAKRAGITEIILSEDNKKDISDINEHYLQGLTFIYVKDAEEVLKYSLM